MDELNARDFRVFPQKANPGKFTMSIQDGEDRFFLTRTTSGELNEDGSANYKWARGSQMRPQGNNAGGLEE